MFSVLMSEDGSDHATVYIGGGRWLLVWMRGKLHGW